MPNSASPPPEMLPLSSFMEQTKTAESLASLYATLHARACTVPALFLTVTPLPELLTALHTLSATDPTRSLPLHAVPYVLKDNIDLPPHPTSAACPSYAYVPTAPAFVVDLLTAAGALCLGKVNMDQFASGLVGTRSPHGAPTNIHHPAYIPGGSSSGSAVAVAHGLAVFALGTDTAGSGRVPAAMNGLVGLKPTKGLLSTSGVVPAAKSLDCVSILATCVPDAALVLQIVAEWDPHNVFSRLPPQSLSVLRSENQIPAPSRFRFGVPLDTDLTFEGDDVSRASFDSAVAVLEGMGGVQVSIDFEPFREAASLLYDNSFVAERFTAVGKFIQMQSARKPEDLDPIVAKIVLDSEHIPAWTVFDAQEKLMLCVRRAKEHAWDKIDVLFLPTIPKPVTLQEVADNPVSINSMLGTYTNFVNLMDYCAIAVPTPAIHDSVPRGVTFIAEAFKENLLIALGEKYENSVQNTSH